MGVLSRRRFLALLPDSGWTEQRLVDGGPWAARSGTFATGPTSGKGSFSAFPNGAPDGKVRVYDIEFGLGWPKR